MKELVVRLRGAIACSLVLGLGLSGSAHGESVIRKGPFQSKMGTEDAVTCGDFVWALSDEDGDRKKDPGETWIFRIENCPEVAALLDVPEPDPFCGDGTADDGEECGEPGLPSCSQGFQCNASCACQAIPDPSGMCKDGTPERDRLGFYNVSSVNIPKGTFASYCIDVPATGQTVTANTRNRASVTCVNFTMLLRHTNTASYPLVKREDSSSSPDAELTKRCGFNQCPWQLPAGTYEIRITANMDECNSLAVTIASY
jgi:hypothetical protein